MAAMNYADFEGIARSRLSQHYGVLLTKRRVPGIPKEFDMVSPDGLIIGDAEYLTLVRGTYLPPAKFSMIAEHVWLLEKTTAKTKFLAFGNDRRVPELWLETYRRLVNDVAFFFFDGTRLERLHP